MTPIRPRRFLPPSERPLAKEDEGVSAVVGAVLLLLVATLFVVQWRLEWIPTLESEKEAGHGLAVDAQLGQLRAHLNHLATNRSDDVAGLPVSLGAPASTSLSEGTRVPSVLAFRAENANLTFRAADMQVLKRNGHPQGVPANAWTAFGGVIQFSDVHSIQDLRLRIADVNALHNTRTASVNLLDDVGAPLGSYTVRVNHQSPNLLVHHEVRNGAGELVTSAMESFEEASSFSPYFVDVLASETAFRQVIANAPQPFQVRLAYDPGFNTDYIARYHVVDSEGVVVPVISGGQQVLNWEEVLVSGTLSYFAQNQYYPAQTIRMANGAMVLAQDEGRLFRAEPPLQIRSVNNVLYLDWSMPLMEGPDQALAGDMVVHTFAAPLEHRSMTGSAASMDFTLQTPDPGLWASLFRQRLVATGLSESGLFPGFTITTTGDEVTVSIIGPDSDPLSSVRDVVLSYRVTRVYVQIQG